MINPIHKRMELIRMNLAQDNTTLTGLRHRIRHRLRSRTDMLSPQERALTESIDALLAKENTLSDRQTGWLLAILDPTEMVAKEMAA